MIKVIEDWKRWEPDQQSQVRISTLLQRVFTSYEDLAALLRGLEFHFNHAPEEGFFFSVTTTHDLENVSFNQKAAASLALKLLRTVSSISTRVIECSPNEIGTRHFRVTWSQLALALDAEKSRAPYQSPALSFDEIYELTLGANAVVAKTITVNSAKDALQFINCVGGDYLQDSACIIPSYFNHTEYIGGVKYSWVRAKNLYGEKIFADGCKRELHAVHFIYNITDGMLNTPEFAPPNCLQCCAVYDTNFTFLRVYDRGKITHINITGSNDNAE